MDRSIGIKDDATAMREGGELVCAEWQGNSVEAFFLDGSLDASSEEEVIMAEKLLSNQFKEVDAIGRCYIMQCSAWNGDEESCHQCLFLDLSGSSVYANGQNNPPSTFEGTVLHLGFKNEGDMTALVAKPIFEPIYMSSALSSGYRLVRLTLILGSDMFEKITYIGHCENVGGHATPNEWRAAIEANVVVPSFLALAGGNESVSTELIDAVNLDLTMYGLDTVIEGGPSQGQAWSFDLNNFTFLAEFAKRMGIHGPQMGTHAPKTVKQLTNSICSALWMRYQKKSKKQTMLFNK